MCIHIYIYIYKCIYVYAHSQQTPEHILGLRGRGGGRGGQPPGGRPCQGPGGEGKTYNVICIYVNNQIIKHI